MMMKRVKVIMNMMDENLIIEEWKQIKIQDDLVDYEVSNTGKVRRIKTGLILSPGERGKPGNKYLFVVIYKEGIPYHCSLHRLVAEDFIPNSENKSQVNHKNGKKSDNYYTNLEWATQVENINHAIEAGLMKAPGKGIDGRNVKYSENDVHNVCALLEKSIPINDIVSKLNVSRAFIIGIKYNNNWEDIRSNYIIPESNPYGERTSDQIDMIDEVLHSGLRNKQEILMRVGLPDTKTHRRYIKYRLAKMVKCSTTIEHSDVGVNTTSSSK